MKGNIYKKHDRDTTTNDLNPVVVELLPIQKQEEILRRNFAENCAKL